MSRSAVSPAGNGTTSFGNLAARAATTSAPRRCIPTSSWTATLPRRRWTHLRVWRLAVRGLPRRSRLWRRRRVRVVPLPLATLHHRRACVLALDGLRVERQRFEPRQCCGERRIIDARRVELLVDPLRQPHRLYARHVARTRAEGQPVQRVGYGLVCRGQGRGCGGLRMSCHHGDKRQDGKGAGPHELTSY